MKKLLSLIFVFVLMLTLASCKMSQKGVVLTSHKTVYSSDNKNLIVEWTNNLDEEIFFGNPFTLEKYSSEWSLVETKIEVAFTMPAYPIDAGKSRTHTYNLDAYEDLQKGKYRISTTYMISSDEENTEYPVYFEFEIE